MAVQQTEPANRTSNEPKQMDHAEALWNKYRVKWTFN